MTHFSPDIAYPFTCDCLPLNQTIDVFRWHIWMTMWWYARALSSSCLFLGNTYTKRFHFSFWLIYKFSFLTQKDHLHVPNYILVAYWCRQSTKLGWRCYSKAPVRWQDVSIADSYVVSFLFGIFTPIYGEDEPNLSQMGLVKNHQLAWL